MWNQPNQPDGSSKAAESFQKEERPIAFAVAVPLGLLGGIALGFFVLRNVGMGMLMGLCAGALLGTAAKWIWSHAKRKG